MKTARELNWEARLAGVRHPPGGEEERVIATDAQSSYRYANEVLHGSFELGEEAMATSGEFAFRYSKFIAEQRFIIGEPAIFSSNRATDYVSEHRGQFTDEELCILKMKYPNIS